MSGPVVEASDLLEYMVGAECGVCGAVCGAVCGVCLREAEAKG